MMLDVSLATLPLIYPDAALAVIEDHQCVHTFSEVFRPSIGYIEYNIWGISNFEFPAPNGLCGSSYVNFGNLISCFEMTPYGVCRTSFPPVSTTAAYGYIYIAGTGVSVDVSRVGIGPLYRRSQLEPVVNALANAGATVTVDIELEALPLIPHCGIYPAHITDAGGVDYIRVEVESWCEASLSAVYIGSHAVKESQFATSNGTHRIYRYRTGGAASICWGRGGCLADDTEITYAIPIPPSIPASGVVGIMLMATLIPVGVIGLFGGGLLFSIWLSAHST